MSQHIDPEVKQSFIVDNLTTNDAGKALSAKQGKALDDKITTLNGKITTLETQAVRNLADFRGTTKANITTSLRNTYGGNFVVFATLYDMTDGTTAGFYIIWREGNMSGTTQFFKLS